jgi:hypothetical protein
MKVSGQFHTPDALPPGRSPWYLLDRRLVRPQAVGTILRNEHFFTLPGFELRPQPVTSGYTD